MPTDADRVTARLDAFRLVEASQSHDVSEALADAHTVARAHGWPEVTLVLLYAEVAAGLISSDHAVDETIARLHDRAEAAGDQAMLAAALASRAERHLNADEPLVRQNSYHDLARATALVERATGPALERATAYVACASAYSARELWELEEELYIAVTPLLAECELPLLDAVVPFNRAEAFLRVLCGLREVDEIAELRQLAPAAEGAIGAARGQSMPGSWVVEIEVFGHLHAALVGASAPDADDLDRRVSAELSVRADPVRGMLRLADALRAADDADWERVAEQAREAIELSSQDEVAAFVTALALRLMAQAETGGGTGIGGHALRYADYCVRRRWELRRQMVGSARASLQIEQLRLERDRHARAALVDELTGLPNRRGYNRHLQGLRRRRGDSPMAVLLVDIDSFKAVNDNHGHAAGDEVLTWIARTLERGIRSVDLVARLGGDEFVAMLDGLDAEAAYRRAVDLRSRLAEVPWTSIAPGLDVAVSIGVAASELDNDPENLVRRADAALYAAKARGGDRVEAEGPMSARDNDAVSRVRRTDRARPE